MKQAYGPLAKRVSQRMESLQAADHLAVILSLPALECHPLHKERTGQWAISISGNWRIIFEITQDPIPQMEDKSIDFSKVTQIRILEIVDYH